MVDTDSVLLISGLHQAESADRTFGGQSLAVVVSERWLCLFWILRLKFCLTLVSSDGILCR